MCEYATLANMMKNPWVVVTLFAVVLIFGAVLFSNAVDDKNNEDIQITSHVKGNQEAKVKLVEYSDFQCPSCAGFQLIIEAMLEQVGEDISFEFRSFPLSLSNPASVLSAVAAEAAAQQGRFFEYHDLLFENQLIWSTSATPNVLFIQFAKDLGLDIDLFKKHMSASVLIDKVKASREEGISMGVSQTPSFFLNGELMIINSHEDFMQQILMAVNLYSSSTTQQNINPDGIKFGI